MSNPNQPPQGANVDPRDVADRVASRLGREAMGGATPESNPGEAALNDMRARFRDGSVPMGGKAPVDEQVQRRVAAWRARRPPDDPMADSVAERFANAWSRYSGARGEHRDDLEQALTQYHADTWHAQRELGLTRSAVNNALYNTRQELDDAIAPRSGATLRPAEARRCAELNQRNVPMGVRRAERNVRAVEEAAADGRIPDPKTLDRKTVIHFANRESDPAAMVDRAANYQANKKRLAERYKDDPNITPTMISQICRSTTDPENALGDKVRFAERLRAEYKGRAGLTAGEINHCAFSQSTVNARRKLDTVVNDVGVIHERLGGRLPPARVRGLILEHDDPVRAGQDRLRKADAIKEHFAGNPDAQSVLRDSDYVEFARLHAKVDDACNAADTFTRRVTQVREELRGTSGVTDHMIRAASATDSYTPAHDVKRMVRQVDTLGQQNAGQGVPGSILERAVVEHGDNPQGYVSTFVHNREIIRGEWGDRIAPHAATRICMNSEDPVREARARIAVVDTAKARYGDLDPRLEQRVITKILTASGRDAEVIVVEVYTPRVMEEMRDNVRAGRRVRTTEEAEYASRVAGSAREWLHESGIEGVSATDLTERFGRSWAIQTRNNPELRNDAQMAKAAFTQYARDAATLAESGFRNPGAVAQHNNPDTLLAVLGGLSEDTQTATRRGHTVSDLRARAAEYETAVRNIEAAGVGTTASDAVKRSAVMNDRDPVGALRRYDGNKADLPGMFEDEAVVNEKVIERYAMRPDAEGEVRDFLRREAMLEAILGDDPHFTAEVRREIALNFDSDDPDILLRAAQEWRIRFDRLREANAHSGSGVPEWALAEAAVRGYSDPEAAIRYAAGIVKREVKDERLDDPTQTKRGSDKVWGQEDREADVADPRRDAQNPQDIRTQRENMAERARMLRRLTEGLTDAERDLIAIRFTGDVVDADVEDLKRRLGTDDLDAYLAELLERLRRRAEEAGMRNPYDRGGRSQGGESDQQQAGSQQAGGPDRSRSQGQQDQSQGGEQRHRGQRSADDRQRASDDLDERLRRQQERMRDDFDDRLGTLTPDERALMEYKLRGGNDPEVEAELRRRLHTDDLDGYYDGLRNYLGLSSEPDQSGSTNADSENGGSGNTEDAGSTTGEHHRRDPGTSDGGGVSRGNYTAETVNPRGIARQLIHIVEDMPLVKMSTDSGVITNVIFAIHEEINEFNSAHAAAAASSMDYAREYVQQAVQQLLAAGAYAEAYLAGVVGSELQIELPHVIIDPGEPQADTEYLVTVARLLDEYTVLLRNTEELLAAIRWTGEGSVAETLVISATSAAGSMQSILSSTSMFAQTLTLMGAHAAEKASAKIEEERRKEQERYDGTHGGDQTGEDPPRTEQW